MLSAVVDTNVIVAGVLSSNPTSASRALMDRLRAGEFLLLLSPEALLEIEEVLALAEMKAIHGLTDDEIRTLSGTTSISAALTRDVTDTKWVAIAIEGDADCLVTKDRRHLHRLKRAGRAKIVTPRKFLKVLDHRK
jgi:putative PIN family toxin of toxin-antitoxin system